MKDFDGTSVYASAVQRIVTAFDNYIGERADKGVAIPGFVILRIVHEITNG